MKKAFLALLAASTLMIACGEKAPATANSITSDGRIIVENVDLVFSSDSGAMTKTALENGSKIIAYDTENDSTIISVDYKDNKATIDLAGAESTLTMQSTTKFFAKIIPDATISNDKAKIGAVMFVAHNEQGREIGDVILSDLPTAGSVEPNDFSILGLLYSDAEVEIKGESEMMGITIIVDAKLKKGWNNFISSTKIDLENETGVISFHTSDTPIANAKWMIRSF